MHLIFSGMQKIIFHRFRLVLMALSALVSVCLFVSCGVDSGHFRLTGDFKNLKQGEFYIYSPDNASLHIDTIHVVKGSFTYETPMQENSTLVVVFPNFYERAVFATPGKEISMHGDATHLKDTEVTGDDDNKLYTEFELETSKNGDADIKKRISKFIDENPHSRVAQYLVNKYMVFTDKPNYRDASEMLKRLAKAQPEEPHLGEWAARLGNMRTEGEQMPTFVTRNIEGRRVANNSLKGDVNVIYLWASWRYESVSVIKMLKKMKNKYGNRLGVLTISLDADMYRIRERIRLDSLRWDMVQEKDMFEGDLLPSLGMYTVPDNIVFDRNGRILGRTLDRKQLEDLIKSKLDK